MEPWIIIIMLGIAALIYALMLPTKKTDNISSDTLIKNVETTLEQYMSDIESENDSIVELVGQMKKETTSKQIVLEDNLALLNQRLLEVEKQTLEYDSRIAESILSHKNSGEGISSKASPTEDLMVVAESEDVNVHAAQEDTIKRRYAEVFDLHEQGKSMDVIGKITGLHRGEVQLILQLAKQEGSL
ncbi:hypothetical protein [Paenibacillus sp. CMAA1364]